MKRERRLTAPDGKEIRVVFATFPKGEGDIHGGTVLTPEGYLIAVNSNSPRRKQRHTLGHELAHIFLAHFDLATGTLRKIEKEADAAAYRFYLRYRLRLL